MDPIAQHNVFRLFHDQSSPLSCLLSFFSIWSDTRIWKHYESRNIAADHKTIFSETPCQSKEMIINNTQWKVKVHQSQKQLATVTWKYVEDKQMNSSTITKSLKYKTNCKLTRRQLKLLEPPFQELVKKDRIIISTRTTTDQDLMHLQQLPYAHNNWEK